MTAQTGCTRPIGVAMKPLREGWTTAGAASCPDALPEHDVAWVFPRPHFWRISTCSGSVWYRCKSRWGNEIVMLAACMASLIRRRTAVSMT